MNHFCASTNDFTCRDFMPDSPTSPLNFAAQPQLELCCEADNGV
jgi:hypothetical protein